MDDRSLFDELVRVATRLGVEVRIEPFETPPARGGGRCLVDGRELILLDARAPLVIGWARWPRRWPAWTWTTST